VREAAHKAGGRGASGAAARDAVDRVMLQALHGIGKSGDWCRQGALGSAAKGMAGGLGTKKSGGGGGGDPPPPIDYARLLARKSCATLLREAALPLVKAGYPKTDVDGGRCILRMLAWIVGIRNAMEPEDAIITALHVQLKSDWNPVEHTTSMVEHLIGDETVCVAMLQLLEALARRRVSNIGKLHHGFDVLIRIFSFRASPKSRCAATSLMAWGARCPRNKSFMFDMRYDDNTLQPVYTAQKDYMRLIGIDTWLVSPESPEYTEETGICLSDGGEQAGIFSRNSISKQRWRGARRAGEASPRALPPHGRPPPSASRA